MQLSTTVLSITFGFSVEEGKNCIRVYHNATHLFDYYLNEDLIAQTPLEKRDSSKLLVLDKQNGNIFHKTFTNIIDYLEEGDTLVLNDTKVIPARIIGIKEETNAVIELLLLKNTNEDYWETKKGAIEMNYREYGEGYSEGYGNYGRRRRDSRGRYMAGRGGNRGGRSYQGEEALEDMQEQYQRYSEGKEDMNMGNYGAHSSTMKSLEYMLESVVEFIEMLKKDAGSQEEVELIKKYTREISEM